MNRTAVKNYANRARREYLRIVSERANALGIAADGIAKAEPAGDMIVIKGRPFPKAIESPRRELAEKVRRDGFELTMRNAAYTLFNRFCALRFMEANGYLPFRLFSAADGGDTPDILKHAVEAAEALTVTGAQREQIIDLKLRGDQDQKLYSMLLLAQCNALSAAMPFLFERPNDLSELLMPENLLHSDSVVRDLAAAIPEDDWREIEIVGWLYQFYISEKKDQVIGKVVKKEDIPAATQLFTPKWIVQYMVENSLGRLWLQNHPDSQIKTRMPYYIEDEPRTDAETRESEPPDKVKDSRSLAIDTPEDIKCMDPCCGSGHILVYMFDLLSAMYEESGYLQRDIPRLILKNNLFGLDIDERAAQLAGFALMMKARERDPRFLIHAVQPRVMAIEESNGLDLRAELRIEGQSDRSPFESDDVLIADDSLLPAQRKSGTRNDELAVFAQLVRFFHDAKNYGSLLRIPPSLAGNLDELETRIAKLRGNTALFAGAILPQLEQLTRQARMLADKYHVVTTNPPYMGGKGMNTEVKAFAKDQYPDSKADLFAMFIERSLTYVEPCGMVGMITMQSWMFLSSYEKLRARILDEATILSMAHLGARAFDSIGGEVVSTTAFVLENEHRAEYKGAYLRLVDGESESEKAMMFQEAIK